MQNWINETNGPWAYDNFLLPETSLASAGAFLHWVILAWSPASSQRPAPPASHPNKSLRIKSSLLRNRGALEREGSCKWSPAQPWWVLQSKWIMGSRSVCLQTWQWRHSDFVRLPALLSCVLTHSSGSGMNHHWCPEAVLWRFARSELALVSQNLFLSQRLI